MKLAIKRVEWTQNVGINSSKFDKSLASSQVSGLWYVGIGVLVEQDGLDDIFVPLANVLRIQADGKLTVDDWSGDSVPSPLVMASLPAKPVRPPPASPYVPESTPVDRPAATTPVEDALIGAANRAATEPGPPVEPAKGGFLRKKPKPKTTSK